MPNFELHKIKELSSHVRFFKLLRNGKCEFDLFIEQINKTGNKGYIHQLDKIFVLMEHLSLGIEIPKNSWKELKGKEKGDLIKDYEFKAGRLRVYWFRDEYDGSIVVIGGIKNDSTQEKHINILGRFKLEYYENKRKK